MVKKRKDDEAKQAHEKACEVLRYIFVAAMVVVFILLVGGIT